MLELLLYCHMFANMRFAGHIAAAADFIGETRMRCGHLLAPLVRGRGEPADGPWLWTEQLDRLDAYVGSLA
jgi:hypothetical protein